MVFEGLLCLPRSLFSNLASPLSSAIALSGPVSANIRGLWSPSLSLDQNSVVWGLAAREVLVGNLVFILVVFIDDQRVTHVKGMYKCFQSSVHFNFPGVSRLFISTWTFFILCHITSDVIVPRFLKWVHYLTCLLSSSYPTSPGCSPLNKMKLSSGSLLFPPHKALAAATAHRKHPIDFQSFNCHVCADDSGIFTSLRRVQTHTSNCIW